VWWTRGGYSLKENRIRVFKICQPRAPPNEGAVVFQKKVSWARERRRVVEGTEVNSVEDSL